MAWEIRVWHENLDDNRARLIIEAGADVPDDVVSSVVGSYWFEQVQYAGEAWENSFPDEPEGTGGHFHG
jgi:hypothetical protein